MAKTKQPKRAPKGGAKPKAAQSKPTKPEPVAATAPATATGDTAAWVGIPTYGLQIKPGEPSVATPDLTKLAADVAAMDTRIKALEDQHPLTTVFEIDGHFNSDHEHTDPAPYGDAERRADADPVKPATAEERAALCEAWGLRETGATDGHKNYVAECSLGMFEVNTSSGAWWVNMLEVFPACETTTLADLEAVFRKHLPYTREWREKAAREAGWRESRDGVWYARARDSGPMVNTEKCFGRVIIEADTHGTPLPDRAAWLKFLRDHAPKAKPTIDDILGATADGKPPLGMDYEEVHQVLRAEVLRLRGQAAEPATAAQKVRDLYAEKAARNAAPAEPSNGVLLAALRKVAEEVGLPAGRTLAEVPDALAAMLVRIGNDENRAERRIEELEQRIQSLELTLEGCEERLRDTRHLAAACNTILVDARDSPHPDRPVFTNHGVQLLAVTAHLATTNVAERVQKALQAPRTQKTPQPNNEAAF